MDQVTLGDIPMRLGIRYVHVCHGDVETSVFLSDVTMRMKDEIIEKSQYPLLHDIWTTSTSSLVHGVGVCEGCHHCPAVVLTIEDELADGGPTPFCRTCYEKLHYHGCGNHEKDVSESENTTTTTLRYNNFKVVPMSVLQNFIDLSVGHDSETTLF
jgi:snRNA-activating protein of 50kDa MW C terminal.